MTATQRGAVRPPGRPRNTRVDEAIIESVLELLAGGTTCEALAIETVAAHAGVGKATIYRRWPNKEALLVDAIASLKGPMPEPAGRSVREDLVTLLAFMLRARESREARILPCIIPEMYRNAELRERHLALVEARRDVVRAVLRRGVRTGELRADLDVELAVAMLAGPLLQKVVFVASPLPLDAEGLPERMVDTLLAGVAT